MKPTSSKVKMYFSRANRDYTDAHLRLLVELMNRQVPVVSNYWVKTGEGSFCCDIIVGRNIIIEVNGDSHVGTRQTEKDSWKTLSLEKAGYVVHRFKDREVKKNLKEITDKIVFMLGEND